MGFLNEHEIGKRWRRSGGGVGTSCIVYFITINTTDEVMTCIITMKLLGQYRGQVYV